MEDTLVRPQQIDGGEDHAGRGDHRPPPAGDERAQQDEELADEPVQTREPDRTEHDHHEHAGEDGRHLLEPSEVGDLAGVAPLVDHPDEQEQGAGGQPVVDHLQ